VPTRAKLRARSRLIQPQEYRALLVLFSGVVWSLAVIWLNIAGEAKLDLVPGIGLGMFIMFFMFFLLTGAKVIDDSETLTLKCSKSDSCELAS
jgi:hypothetical protein